MRPGLATISGSSASINERGVHEIQLAIDALNLSVQGCLPAHGGLIWLPLQPRVLIPELYSSQLELWQDQSPGLEHPSPRLWTSLLESC